MKPLRTAIQMASVTALFVALSLYASFPVTGQSADIVSVACSSCPGSSANLAPADGCGMSQCGCCVAPDREIPTPFAPTANVSTPPVRADLSFAQSLVVLPRIHDIGRAGFFPHLATPHSATPLYLTYSVFLI